LTPLKASPGNIRELALFVIVTERVMTSGLFSSYQCEAVMLMYGSVDCVTHHRSGFEESMRWASELEARELDLFFFGS